MNQRLSLILFLLFLFFTNPMISQGISVSDFPGTKEGLEALLHSIIEASDDERKEISQQLYPTLEDCEAIFDARLAKKVFKYQRKIHRQIRVVVKPHLEDQTDILLWGVTTEELSDYMGDAKYFPGGYKELAQYFQPQLTFYRFKFIQPGRYLGSAYDVIVYVNGQWKMIHRPWAVLFNW